MGAWVEGGSLTWQHAAEALQQLAFGDAAGKTAGGTKQQASVSNRKASGVGLL